MNKSVRGVEPTFAKRFLKAFLKVWGGVLLALIVAAVLYGGFQGIVAGAQDGHPLLLFLGVVSLLVGVSGIIAFLVWGDCSLKEEPEQSLSGRRKEHE